MRQLGKVKHGIKKLLFIMYNYRNMVMIFKQLLKSHHLLENFKNYFKITFKNEENMAKCNN